jgi:hypothetical protein
VGDLVFEPPRDGPTLWEIGIPDRSAAEFYIPDPDLKYINKLFVNHPDRLATSFGILRSIKSNVSFILSVRINMNDRIVWFIS